MSATQTKVRPVAKVEEDEEDMDSSDLTETKDDTKPSGRVKKVAPKIEPSKALEIKPTFIKQMREAANGYLTIVKEELKTREPGHPQYSELKFAKIRAERVIHSMEELGRGNPIR